VNSSGFLFLIIILGAFWALIVMPRRRKQRAHVSMQESLEVGDEVITAGGLHGHVQSFGDDTVELEISKGVVVTLDRRAVAAVAKEIEVEPEPEEPAPAPESPEEPS
jgi:preprotein translocase subunit YajC